MTDTKISVNQIRKTFLDFFKQKSHLHVAGSSLLPVNDPSLLFTTAGMVPFKPYFSGLEVPPAKRLVSIQKCIRTTDLESVGKTKRHLSFFEMLGNFSFGDYFKKEAIEFAWDLSTNFLPFDKDRIWVTVFQDDDEAFDIWKNHIGFNEKKIVRLGKKDNFWGPAGNTGACGPCSELYLDRGEEFRTTPDDNAPGSDGERFMEFWNLVFNQFNKNEAGEYVPLAQTGIDTGAGLERLAALLQGVDSVYDIDEFKTLRETISMVYGAPYSGANIVPIRVLCDHVRSLSFAMADGIFPSNESRGYVLRRMLRRAMLFGRRLGQNQALLYQVVNTVKNIYQEFYPELGSNAAQIQEYIRTEEDRFLSTLNTGAEKMEYLLEKAASAENKTISGEEVFLMYDTFGFPPEMTAEMAEAKNLKVDLAGFQRAMEAQRERGRKAWKGSSETLKLNSDLVSEFNGYDRITDKAKILAIYADNELVKSISVDKTASAILIITDRTPFYAESGGQLADMGVIRGSNGWLSVTDVQKYAKALVHIGKEINGSLQIGEEVTLEIDPQRRKNLMSNHSATHLLNAALMKNLGKHIKQSGSLVNDSYLRFDFTHPKALTEEELNKIEDEVNENIRREIPVVTEVLPIDEAKNKGAVMTFGEKYGDIVRIVEMGDASKEFCGGTHVNNTAEIKHFFILKDSSPGAGNRRIEAVSSNSALATLDQLRQNIMTILDIISGTALDSPQLTSDTELLSQMLAKTKEDPPTLDLYRELKQFSYQADNLFSEFKKQQKKKKEGGGKNKDDLFTVLSSAAVENLFFGDTPLLIYSFNNLQVTDLKSVADMLREKDANKIYLLLSHSNTENRWHLVAAMAKKMAESLNLNLGNQVKGFFTVNKQWQGGGGGKAELAQASGSFAPEESAGKIKLLQSEIRNIIYQKFS